MAASLQLHHHGAVASPVSSVLPKLFLVILSLSLSLSSLPNVVLAQYSGDGTAYGSSWQGGACLYQDLPAPAKTSFVAINQVLWDTMGMQNVCGRCVRIRSGSRPPVVGMVTNRCPECKVGDLDLSDDLFLRVTGSYPARLPISWELIDCDADMGVSGDVGFYVKDGTNGNWLAVQPVNFRSRIEQLELEYPVGKKTEMVFGTSGLNYYLAAGMQISGSYRLHATDASGNSYTSQMIQGVNAGSWIATDGASVAPEIWAAAAPSSAADSPSQQPTRSLRSRRVV